ncbi:FecR family protein [Ferrovibrio sp.]|uniref:FecR family protein n=1 Tax=Ferrovibrio sp. TaxID=1917215 RepID=UPI0025C3E8B4|nr:FecR domain-containing protein [Ferrovibrio sp.]MBX3454674.1 FecR domain-containing protein [Ferrovibrio sp.]
MTYRTIPNSAPNSADEWIVALNDNPADGRLRQQHSQWLEQSDRNRRDWNESLHVWQMLDRTVPAHVEAWGRQLGKACGDTVVPLPQRRGRVALAAAAAIAAVLAVAVLPHTIRRLGADVATASGEIRTLDLPDGSRLQLAPQSTVAFSFDADRRQVELLRGEAWFDVVPMTGQTFRVVAGDVKVSVLGTGFEVRRDGRDVSVAVDHGRVQVDFAAMSQVLGAGEVLHLGDGRQLQVEKVSPELIASWRSGQLVAKNQTIREAAAALNRYFDGWIIVADDNLGRQPLTGVYALSNPRASLAAIARVQGATVHEISPWLLVISSN